MTTRPPPGCSSVNLYCQDESRFGLFTRAGKGITAKGVKPVCAFQQVFQYTYVFGAYSPISGDNFQLELPCCSGYTFQIFLDHFATHRPEELKIMILDNGAFHKTKHLSWPLNVRPLFLPPYAPELNPAEKVWWRFKRAYTNMTFETLDQLSDFIAKQVHSLSPTEVKSICNFDYFNIARHLWAIS
ncbi:MAG: transposase [Flavobacteriales bacterium]|nr:transposase [Flavobacteriales bacterium]